jgi:hypothetical protein
MSLNFINTLSMETRIEYGPIGSTWLMPFGKVQSYSSLPIMVISMIHRLTTSHLAFHSYLV